MNKEQNQKNKVKRIAKKLLTYYGSLIAFSLLASALIQLFFDYQGHISNSQKNLDILAQQQRLYFEKYIEDYKQLAMTLSNARDLVDESIPYEERYEFSQKLKEKFNIKDLGLGDSEGNLHIYTPQEPFVINLSDREYVQKGLKTQEPVVSSVMIDKISDALTLTLFVPINENLNPNGNLKYLLIDLNASVLKEVIHDFQYLETGHAFLINTKGNVFSHTDDNMVDMNSSLLNRSITSNDDVARFIRYAIDNKNGHAQYKFDGVEKIAAFSEIPNSDWIVIVSIEKKEILAQLKHNVLINAVIFVVIIVFSILVSYLLGKSISKRINVLSKALKNLFEYNVNFEIEHIEKFEMLRQKDEIDLSILSANMVKDRLKEMVDKTTDSSNQIYHAAKSVANTTDKSSHAATDILSAIQEVADGAVLLTSQAEQGVESVEKMNHALKSNQLLLNNLNEEADKILDYKNAGLDKINTLYQISQENSQMFFLINSIVNETNESSKEIQASTEMIQQIASQTNLLALNAAIEAARAGEQGKGFAVVAEEIRKLAENSSSFTQKISLIVEGLSSKVSQVVDTMKNTEKIVTAQQINTEETKAEFENISQALDKMTDVINHINDSEKNIFIEKENVKTIVETIALIATENTASTEEITSAIDEQTAQVQNLQSESYELSNISEDLLELVKVFK